MEAFLDTSVLIATFYGDHEHHGPSIDLFLRYERSAACCGAHSLAEVYASLTGMPGKDRVSPDEALLFIGNIRDRLTIITLTDEEYFGTLETSAGLGIISGGIYDAVLASCAVKSGAKSIYTWNLRHFKRLGLEIARRVTIP